MRVAAVLSALTISVMALVGVPTVADAATGGDISGTVTRAGDAAPLGDVCIAASDPTSHAYGAGRTGADGTYAVHVPAGSYQVTFTDCGGRDLIHQTWHDSSGVTQFVNVVDGATVGGIDAALQQGGSISGLVTDSAGAPVAGALVTLRSPQGRAVTIESDGQNYTDSAGRYALHGVTPGNLIVQFGPLISGSQEFAGIFNGQVEDPTQAPQITIGPGTGATADAQLPRAATVTGTVRDETGAGYGGVCVYILMGASDGYGDAGVTTSADGTYSFAGLAPGDYRVQFLSCGATTSQWYAGAADQASATVLSLTEGQTVSGIDGVLSRGLHIGGTITDDQGNPLSTVIVSVYNAVTGDYTGNYATTDSNGHYEIDGLRGIGYKLIATVGGQHPDLVDRWFPGVPLKAAATPVVLAPGLSVDNADFSLPHGATVSGTVTDDAGNPLADVCVSLEEVTEGQGHGARTDGYGHYTVVGVDLGSYRVVFQPCNGANLAVTYWGGDDEPASAQLLTVALGDTRTAVDQVMHPGAMISGHVQDSAGNSLSGICIAAQRLVASLGSRVEAATDASGNYRLVGLTPHDDWRTWFFSCGTGKYVNAYNGGAYDITKAPGISTSSGVEVTGVDATMSRAGSISGSVTDQFGNRVYGVCVQAGDSTSGANAGNATDNSGTFTLGGLPPGTYSLSFSDCGAWLANSVFSSVNYDVTEGVTTAIGDTRVTVVTTPSAPLTVSATPGDGSAVVSWAPPADNGAAPITGYDVTTNGRQVAHVSGTSRRATISGLHNGTSYSFTVDAANRRGVGAESTAVKTTPRPASTLSEKAPYSLTWGSPAHIVGALHDKRTGAALRGRVVYLYARGYAATTWRLLATASTSSTGGYSFTHRLGTTSAVRVVFRGDSTHVASSNSRLVHLRPTVGVVLSGRQLVATISPHLVGAHVLLQKSAAGSWMTVMARTLTTKGSAVFDLGRGRYRVVLPATRGYLRAASGPVGIV